MIKKVISFILVLALVLSLSCTAFATNSPAESGKPSSNPKTGDDITQWVATMVVTASALGAMALLNKKRTAC